MSHATLTGTAAGDWWHRAGIAEGWTLDVQAFHGATATTNVLSAGSTPTRIASVQVDLAAGTADYDVAQTFQTVADQFQSSQSSFLSGVQSNVQQLLINMVNLDTAQPSTDLTTAVEWLITAMNADTATINQGTLPAVGAQTSAPGVTPTGNPTFVWSAKDSAGRGLQYVFAETATALITQDSQNGATKGSEPYSVTGQNAQSNFLSWDWQKSSKYGSGATLTGNLIDPLTNCTSSTGGANLLVNGAVLVTTTANQTDNWTILTGTAGSTITATAASGGYITGSGVIVMVSDGTTDLAVTQAFNTASTTTVGAGGTPFTLVPAAINNQQIAVFVPFKQSVGNPVAGVLQVDLVDSTNTIITDDQGTQNKNTITLGGASLGTGWQVLTAVFRMPKVLSTNTPYKLRIWQSTAVSSGTNISLSCMAAAVLSQMYAGGPFTVGFRGSTDVNASGAAADAWTFAITNTPGKLQKFFWRYFNPPSLGAQTPGLMIPNTTSGSATIPDSLVA